MPLLDRITQGVLVWCIGALLAPGFLWADTPTPSALLYVSDYVSFVGSDSDGYVAFALDNNRGRDGARYQAEHFVVLHDQREGWISLTGGGSYDNVHQELARIPDSPFFQFRGTPESGLTVSSPSNQLTLTVEPLPERMRQTHAEASTWIGSAPAVLTWRSRTIPGRVLYEYLRMPGFNRLTRTYWGLWKDFQGFYLTTDREGDLYLHSQQSEVIAALVGKLVGFSMLGDETEPLKDLRVEVLDRAFAFGFYRWPTAWKITWTGQRGPAELTLTASERKTFGGWIIGGFAMSLVRGELRYDGRTRSIYGLAELLM